MEDFSWGCWSTASALFLLLIHAFTPSTKFLQSGTNQSAFPDSTIFFHKSPLSRKRSCHHFPLLLSLLIKTYSSFKASGVLIPPAFQRKIFNWSNFSILNLCILCFFPWFFISVLFPRCPTFQYKVLISQITEKVTVDNY